MKTKTQVNFYPRTNRGVNSLYGLDDEEIATIKVEAKKLEIDGYIVLGYSYNKNYLSISYKEK